MVLNKIDIYKVLGGVLVGALVMFFFMKEEPVEVDVPVEFDFKTPEIVKGTDTVYYPSPVYVKGDKEVDSIYFEEYTKLKDSLAKEELFKEAITINEYKEVVEDDTLKIDLYAKTRGTLLEYQIDYKVKPQTYHIDTTLTVKIPQKPKFYIGGEVVMPSDLVNYKVAIEPGVFFVNKKQTKAYKLSYDPINKVGKAGLYFRL